METTHVIRIEGDVKDIETKLKDVARNMQQLNDNEIVINLDYDGNPKNYQKTLQKIIKSHPQLTVQFQYDANESLLFQQKKKLEKQLQLKAAIDSGNADKEINSMLANIRKNASDGIIPAKELRSQVKELFQFINTAGSKTSFKIGGKDAAKNVQDILANYVRDNEKYATTLDLIEAQSDRIISERRSGLKFSIDALKKEVKELEDIQSHLLSEGASKHTPKEVYINVNANAEGFIEDVQQQIKSQGDVEVNITPNTESFIAKIQDSIKSGKVSIEVEGEYNKDSDNQIQVKNQEDKINSVRDVLRNYFNNKETGFNTQANGKDIFQYIVEHGTEAEKELLKVKDGYLDFQKVLRGASFASKGEFDYIENLGLDYLNYTKLDNTNNNKLDDNKKLNLNIERELSDLEKLETKISMDIPNAIDKKDNAFYNEADVVDLVVENEINALNRLQNKLEEVTGSVNSKSDAFKNIEPTETAKDTKDTNTSSKDGNKKDNSKKRARKGIPDSQYATIDPSDKQIWDWVESKSEELKGNLGEVLKIQRDMNAEYESYLVKFEKGSAIMGKDSKDQLLKTSQVLYDSKADEQSVRNKKDLNQQLDLQKEKLSNVISELVEFKADTSTVDAGITDLAYDLNKISDSDSLKSWKADFAIMQEQIKSLRKENQQLLQDEKQQAKEQKALRERANKGVAKEFVQQRMAEEKEFLDQQKQQAKEQEKAQQQAAKEARDIHIQRQSVKPNQEENLKSVTNAYRKLLETREKIVKLDSNKKNYNSDFTKLQQEESARKNALNDVIKIAKANDETLTTEKLLAENAKIREEHEARISAIKKDQNTAVQKSLDNELNKNLDSARNKANKYTDSSKVGTNIASEIEKQLTQIDDLKERISKNNNIISEEDVAEAKSIRESIEAIAKKSPDKTSNIANPNRQASVLGNIANELQNTGYSKDALRDLRAFYNELRNAPATASRLDTINEQFKRIVANEKAAGRGGQSFLSGLGNRIKSITQSAIAMSFSFYDVIRYGRQVAETVIEIDSAMTELAKVSGASDARLNQSFETSANTAKELGATITDVINSTSDWARSGYDTTAAEELARVTTLYQRVGDNMTQESASESLVSTLRGFQMDYTEAEHIVDVINEASNNMAISSEGIGDALQRSAAAFNVGNTSLEKATSVISGINEIAQNPEKVGNAIKTLTARLRGATTELEDMGEDTDGVVESTSKLRDMVKSMTGFDIMIDENTYKDIYDIIVGIGEQFESLSDIDQAALLEALAGKNQSNILASAFKNVDRIKEAYDLVSDAEGSAQKEFSRQAESVDYSIERAKASLQELANDILSSDLLKWAIDVGNAFVNMTDSIAKAGAAIPTLAGLVAGFFGAKNQGRDEIHSLSNMPCLYRFAI